MESYILHSLKHAETNGDSHGSSNSSARVLLIDSSLLPRGINFQDKAQEKVIRDEISSILDVMGVASKVAQGLSSQITSGEKLAQSDHLIFLMVTSVAEGLRVLGYLKIGRKNLFLYDASAKLHEEKCWCVLDFYVTEDMQRKGIGHCLFERMLQEIGLKAEKLPLDKPSEKLLTFMNKYYGLKSVIQQSNSFVVYDRFFAVGTDYLDKGSDDSHMTFQSLATYGRNAAKKPQTSNALNFESAPKFDAKGEHVSAERNHQSQSDNKSEGDNLLVVGEGRFKNGGTDKQDFGNKENHGLKHFVTDDDPPAGMQEQHMEQHAINDCVYRELVNQKNQHTDLW